VDYAAAIGVHLGLRSRPDETATLLQIPATEHPDLVGMIFEHNKAPGRAPAGRGLVSTLWRSDWARRQWERDDGDIVDEAIATLSRVLPGMPIDLDCAHVQRWRFGPDVPRPGVHRAMRDFHAAANPDSRVRLAGDYLSTASSNAAAASAEKAARELHQLLA
jgi:oxygen-dependent protoporphyrinogen oxidase